MKIGSKFGLSFIVGLVLLYVGVLAISHAEERSELTEQVRAHTNGKFVQLRHGFVHYLLEGKDSADLILFIHGGGVTGMEVWKNTIPYFNKKNYQVLAYDLYGRGYSDRPLVANTPELFSEQLSELLSKLEIKKPINIVAMSMGAIIAFNFAEANPKLVKKIVLLDPAATGDSKPNLILRTPLLNELVLTFFWYPHAVENQRKEFVNKNLFDEYAERLRFFMKFKGFKFSMHSAWLNMQAFDRLAQVKSDFGSNILLIYGNQDPYFNENHCILYRQKFGDIKITRVDSAGHMPHYERPHVVNEIIYSFLSAKR